MPRTAIISAICFGLGVIPELALTVYIGSITRSHGLPFAELNVTVIRDMRNFHLVIRQEPNPQKRASYRRLATAYYIIFAWSLVWFGATVAFILAAA